MAIGPDGQHLYPALEGATVAELGTIRRYVFEFSVRDKTFTGRVWLYRTEQPGYFVSDMAALDRQRRSSMAATVGPGAANSCSSSHSRPVVAGE